MASSRRTMASPSSSASSSSASSQQFKRSKASREHPESRLRNSRFHFGTHCQWTGGTIVSRRLTPLDQLSAALALISRAKPADRPCVPPPVDPCVPRASVLPDRTTVRVCFRGRSLRFAWPGGILLKSIRKPSFGPGNMLNPRPHHPSCGLGVTISRPPGALNSPCSKATPSHSPMCVNGSPGLSTGRQ